MNWLRASLLAQIWLGIFPRQSCGCRSGPGMKRAVGKLLLSEITGDETDEELEDLVENIVCEELEIV